MPFWSGAYIVRNHAYLMFDTLFAPDEKFQPKPEMVESWKARDDKRTLDCVASVKRRGARDPMGQRMILTMKVMRVVDARTFKFEMKEPYGLVIESLSKQISEYIGSGPFVFKQDEWKPRETVRRISQIDVYVNVKEV